MRHKGKGDSVKEIAEFWQDASIEEIHRRVVAWKRARLNTAEEETQNVLRKAFSAELRRSHRVSPKD